jgi:hypothetical protein
MRILWGTAAVPILLVSLAACGAKKSDDGVASLTGKGSAKASASASPLSQAQMEALQLKYAQCMRQHGINMPDPKAGKMSMMIKKGEEAKANAAQAACKQYLPNGGQAPAKADPKMRDQAVKFAQCMRKQGVSVPDPGADGAIKIDGRNVPAAKMQAAQKACSMYQPGIVNQQDGEPGTGSKGGTTSGGGK